MIDVPVEVKDALREGTYKKNYRFIVQEEVTTRSIEDLKVVNLVQSPLGADYTTPYESDYIMHAAAGGTDWEVTLHIIDPNSLSNQLVKFRVKENEESFLTLGHLAAGMQITNYSSSGQALDIDIGITTPDLITYSTSWEDDFTIDNDTLVSESVSIDERMCSGDSLKFGLCEGSSLEFQYFNHVNITGRKIQAFVDVQYKETPWDEVGYIDQEASSPGRTYEITEAGRYLVYFAPDQRDEAAEVSVVRDGMYIGWYEITWYSDDHGEVELPNSEAADIVYIWGMNNKAKATVYKYVSDWYPIPMGFFDVAKCSRQASTGIIKVTAYNKLMSDYLDAKVDIIVADMDSDTGEANIITLQTIQDVLLQGYQINYKEEVELQFTPESTGLGETLSAVNCKLNGSSTTYHPEISSYNSYSLSGDIGNNKRVKIVNLNTYIDVLKHSIDSLKSAVYTSFQNPDTLWNNIKAYALNSFGLKVCVEYNSDPSVPRKYAYYTIEELLNDSYLSPVSTQVTVYGADINKLHYFQIPNLGPAVEYSYIDVLTIRIPEKLSLPVSGGSIPVWTNPYSLSESDVKLYSIEYDDINTIKINISQVSDLTLRDLTTANYELHCQFGQLDRETDLFSGVELNHSRLYPAEDLYPATTLYPDGAAMSATRAMYSKLWADEGNVHKWRYLIITYKGLNEDDQEEDFTLQRTINADGTDDYNMSDNWLFRNLIWTAADVGDYADAMVPKMQDITWFPFEMWCAGLPYLETGDEIEIPLGDESYTSYILQRQLKGIQNLQDTYINGTLDIF